MESGTRSAFGMPPGRLLTLADGIFDLATQLVGLRSAFLTFVISFVVLGVFWFAHHQTFHFLVRVNRTLVWLSIGFFSVVAVSLIITYVLGAHPDDPIALTLYGGAIGLLTVLGYLVVHDRRPRARGRGDGPGPGPQGATLDRRRARDRPRRDRPRVRESPGLVAHLRGPAGPVHRLQSSRRVPRAAPRDRALTLERDRNRCGTGTSSRMSTM